MFGHNEPQNDEEGLSSQDSALPSNSTSSTSLQNDSAGDYIDNAPGSSISPAATGTTANPIPDPQDNDLGAASASTAQADRLLDIKQQALQQLTPLVGHLEQSADERFRTTMMMIQASDNQDLIPTAYEAAQQITDEKARAQALLDIVNEINYFTQNSPASTKDDFSGSLS